MPKMKTHRGAAKRFKITPSGKIKRGQANRTHILEKMASKHKRRLKGPATVAKADEAAVRRLLGK